LGVVPPFALNATALSDAAEQETVNVIPATLQLLKIGVTDAIPVPEPPEATMLPVPELGPVQTSAAPLDALSCVVPVVAVKLSGPLVFHTVADAALAPTSDAHRHAPMTSSLNIFRCIPTPSSRPHRTAIVH
jgi:hypothetical protein